MEVFMTWESRRLSGILMVIFPTVIFGGTSLLTFLVGDPRYMENPLRQNLWRAGHAHAGVLLVLSLLLLRYVDESRLSDKQKRFIRYAVPSAAVFLPVAFFLSVLTPEATEPNALIYLAYIGAILLGAALFTLGIGILRSPRADERVPHQSDAA
jgi:hypothetical protein